MSSNLRRFLGGTPFGAFIRLLVLSFTAGLVLAMFDLLPHEIFSWLERIAARIREMGYETRDVINKFLHFISSPPR